MKTAYTYTVLRYIHDTTTGEFVNVGVALYAGEQRYVSALCRNTYGRLGKVFPGIDGDSFKNLMRYIQSRFDEFGERLRSELPLTALPKGVMEVALTVLPADDSSLQWSPMGSGLTEDPSATLEVLFQRMVARYDERQEKERRSDDEVWRGYRRALEKNHVLGHLKPVKISVEDDEMQFNHTWKNGVLNCLEPVSFDLTAADSIRDKAHRWLGLINSINNPTSPFKLYMLVGEPQKEELRPAFDSAISILNKMPVDSQVIREKDADEFSQRLAKEIAEHSEQ